MAIPLGPETCGFSSTQAPRGTTVAAPIASKIQQNYRSSQNLLPFEFHTWVLKNERREKN